jgi:hypothetical protein
MKSPPRNAFIDCSHVKDFPESWKVPSGNGFRLKFPRAAGELPLQETANLLSVVQTCRRQGRSVLKFFHSALNTHSKLGKSSPSLLPEAVP